MIARVLVLPSSGDTGPLDYAIAEDCLDQIQPGVRVLVPLGSRRVIGIVLEVANESTHPNLKPLAAVLDKEPMLDAALLKLCHWMADYYLASVGDAVTTALPGSMRIRVERVAYARNGSSEVDANGKPLKPAAQELLTHLQREGSVPLPELRHQYGTSADAILTLLRRRGLLEMRDEVRNATARTRIERFYRVAQQLEHEALRALQQRRPAQFALYSYLRQHPLLRAPLRELDISFGNAAAKLRELVKAGLVEVISEEVYRPHLPDTLPQDRIVDLAGSQEAAAKTITEAIDAGRFQPALLWGVTGSGKTEVYLQAIASALRRQRNSLVLVPEISLTHQVVERVRARFGNRVAVLHSGLSDGERWDEWRKIARGEVEIVVGARSAVFAPLPRLGLIVVDEEHDSSYKQDDGLHYNGRDVAIMRAKFSGCPIVLGSATPAMESYYNARCGRYQLLELPERVEARPLPEISIVDLRRASKVGKSILVSSQLIAALRGNLAAHGQSLLFLNRRGYANFLQCVQCGETLPCPNCSVTLTLHQRWQALRCHHCDHTIPVPQNCPACGGSSLGTWGAGTEQVEAAMHQLVPGARVARMDRDTTARKGSLQKLIGAWQAGDYDILVGTQMITKGHDVHDVTLVGVLLADQSLNFPDFRAAERTFQLITQVAGRAGRGDRRGRVIVQTLQPEHVSLSCAQNHDFRHFADIELAARRDLGYPPFSRLVKICCEGERAPDTEKIARAAAAAAQPSAGVQVLGPTPAPIERIRGRFRWQFLLRASSSAAVRNAARRAREAVRKQARSAEVRVLVDVDPYSML